MRVNFALDYDVLTVGQPHKLYLMAYVAADPAPKERERRPLNVSLVIDRSGSMAGAKIDYTRQAAQMLVQNLGLRDTLSIVLYNDTVETLLMPEKVQRKDLINQQIAGIKPGGTTNLSGGWLEGCSLVQRHQSADVLNRVILMTDGLANRGVTDRARLVEMAGQKLGEGISTTTMGLGTDFNEDLLMEMASAGGGAFYFIESPEVTPLIFEEELHGLLNLVGQNLTITLNHGAALSHVRQLNAYPTSSDAGRVTFRMGDVFGDEVKALILELTVLSIPAHQTGALDLGMLTFSYDEINEYGTQRRSWEMPLRVTTAAPGDARPHQINLDVRRAVLLLKAAQARQSAIALADQKRFSEAAEVLRGMVAQIDASGMGSDEQIGEERRALDEQAREMDAGADAYQEYGRKSMATQAFYTMSSRHMETIHLRKREQQRADQTGIVEHVTRKPTLGDGVVPTTLHWRAKHFKLNGDLIRIGRSEENDIVLSVKGISRHHCQLRRQGGKLMLEDLGSTNGTLVNGRRLTGQYAVSVGDEIQIAEEHLRFEGD